MKHTFLLPLLAGALAFTACDDTTEMIGMDIMPDGDNVTAQAKVFEATTRTVPVESVLARTATCYLGSIVDPDLHVQTTSDFLTQIHLPEQFRLPALDRLVVDGEGRPTADSCDVRLYFEEYYGDSLASMKLKVYELDKQHPIDEKQAYYSDINPMDYVTPDANFSKELVYAVKDLTRPESETSGATYYRQVVVKLPADYGTQILRSYFDHPEHFTSNYAFNQHVCPGFYFKHAGGTGAMLKTKMMALNVYFRYHSTTAEGKDTIVDGLQRFGATEEVIQSTRINNRYPGSLSLEAIQQQPFTYVKTPAAFFTEMTLPVADIVGGEHANDSINLAKVTIRKFTDSEGQMIPPPSFLLLVRKDYMPTFFENKELPNSSEAYLSNQYSSASNAYQFSNIGQLITNLRNERDLGAGIVATDTEAQRQQKYAAWEAAHPDWNKVMIVPVAVGTTTSGSSGSQTIQSVSHELGLTSARLEGGNGVPLKVEVVYSRNNH